MISVCMATFNGERYIKSQLDSILTQIGQNDEIIISDDGSNDKTLVIVAQYKDSRIRIFNHRHRKISLPDKYKKGYWCSQNFFNAISKARGDIIFLSDQDDIWMENRVNIFKKELQDVSLVMSNFSIINENNNFIDHAYFKKNPIHKSVILNVITNPFFGCCMAFRRDILNIVLPIPKICVSYDLWIGCLAVRKLSWAFIVEPVHQYRRHGDNTSYATRKSNNNIIFKIFWRFQFLLLVMIRLMIFR